MPKMKMLADWNYAEGGVNVINYKKGEIYDVDARCVELCKKNKRGERWKTFKAKESER